MNLCFKDRIFHIVTLILVLVIIILMANSFSQLAHYWVNNTQNSIIKRILTANDVQEVIAFNESTLDVAQKYSSAILETALTLNEFPSFDTKIFLTIVSALPKNTTIEKFIFRDNKIEIYCITKDDSECTVFSVNLSSEKYFTKIIETVPTNKPDGYHFMITVYY